MNEGKLRDALLSAYDRDSFRDLLATSENLNGGRGYDLGNIAPDKSFGVQVSSVIRYIRGRGEIGNLVAAAYLANPGNQKLEKLLIGSIGASIASLPDSPEGENELDLQWLTRILELEVNVRAVKKEVEAMSATLEQVKTEGESRGDRTDASLARIEKRIDTDVTKNAEDIADIFKILEAVGQRVGINVSATAIQGKFVQILIWAAIAIMVTSGLIVTWDRLSAFVTWF